MDVIAVQDLLIPIEQILTIKVRTEGDKKFYTLMLPYGEVGLSSEETATFDVVVKLNTYNLNAGSGAYEDVLEKIIKHPENVKRVNPASVSGVSLETIIKANEK